MHAALKVAAIDFDHDVMIIHFRALEGVVLSAGFPYSKTSADTLADPLRSCAPAAYLLCLSDSCYRDVLTPFGWAVSLNQPRYF